MSHTRRHVILTGPPGIGKTTLVQKLCQLLKEKNIRVGGFVTQEVRQNGQRTGFEIITVQGRRGTLSSITSTSKQRVVQYGVEVEEFESLALPEFQTSNEGILIIDEIGKMELFSEKFKEAVTKAFKTPNLRIVTTVPIKKGREIPFVEQIRNHPEGKLFTIDKTNRDTILEEIISELESS